ncbi:MAG: ATP-binding cassette domain-containing protein [Spirochaetaceae bacterium]|nr:MAG: ATP-binding cassette domain-containing protein [Spirochaetaceae bacterium]
MIEVEAISKSYGDTAAVRDLSFRSTPGEIFGLLGPNGAGKSTTIRMIMNIIAPDTGRILFKGSPLTVADKDRIGYLPEERGLYKKLTVAEILRYLASLKNVDARTADGRIDEWLERFGLSEWKNKKVDELSKGMAQKVQLTAAVIHDPDFVFLDEPFSGLDPVSTDVLRDAVVDLNRAGKTVLFSTHNMDQAERICHSILILNKGSELISGRLADVKERYGKRSVAIEFDGDLRFLDQHAAVAHVIRYPRWAEVELADGHSADELYTALSGRVSVRRFEVLSPSLHKIFVDQLGGRADARTPSEESNA